MPHKLGFAREENLDISKSNNKSIVLNCTVAINTHRKVKSSRILRSTMK